MFSWFERRINPYPDGPPPQPPAGFFPFLWAASAGVRGLIVAMTLLTTKLGVRLAHAMNPKPLKRAFALFLILVALNMLRKAVGW